MSICTGVGCVACQISRLCQARAFFHVCERENTQRRFSNAFYGRLQAFFLGAKCNDAVLVSQGCWRISGWVGDKGNIRCLLKKVCFSLMDRV